MPHTKKIVATAIGFAMVPAPAVWLFRVPETQAVLIAPVHAFHR
ncbi:MAG: hypothetical protein ACXWG9_10750 [Usitatibacter sp.]